MLNFAKFLLAENASCLLFRVTNIDSAAVPDSQVSLDNLDIMGMVRLLNRECVLWWVYVKYLNLNWNFGPIKVYH